MPPLAQFTRITPFLVKAISFLVIIFLVAGSEGRVKGDDIRFPEQIFEVVVEGHAHRFGLALLYIRIVGDNLHAEAFRP